MEWISVEDRLPENSRPVIINVKYGVGKQKVYGGASYNVKRQEWVCPTWNVTHWMPLPEPPKD